MRIMTRTAAFVLATLVAHSAVAEALPSLSMLSLVYRMSKARVEDDSRQKSLAEVDLALQDAWQAGQMGEARRHLARGLALSSRGTWTDSDDFGASLVLRGTSYIDPSRPAMYQLGQIFPSTLRGRADRAVVTVREERSGRGRAMQPPGKVLSELGSAADFGLDLVESPLAFQADLSAIGDGDFELWFEVYRGDDSLGRASAPIRVRSGLDARITKLRAAAAAAKGQLSADIGYPLDYMRKVDAGLVAAASFDLDAELEAAETLAGARRDPFRKRFGDFERHYLMEEAGEIMPYRVYVPESYSKRRKHPLIVALHGLGGNEDSMFRDFYGMKPLAEEKGYLMVAPMGFRVDGGYGENPIRPNRNGRLSEQDVLNVLELMREAYNVDPERVYLMGHSMGAIGTWRLAAKYPTTWAALGPIAGMGDPRTAETIGHIPQIVVHGDADRTVAVTGSRRMVTALERVGATVNYIEVPGGGHSDIAPANMAAIFEFFDTHRRRAAAD